MRVATRLKDYKLSRVKDSPVVQDRVCLVYRADATTSKSGRLFAQLIEQTLKADS